MENLCDDIASNILIRLPAKNIAQLRRVCKRWNTLLREASFIKSHLRRSINNNDRDEILLVFIGGTPYKAHYSACLDIDLVKFKFPVNFPSYAQLGDINVIGSVNGLICFSVGRPFKYEDDSVIQLCNPSLSTILTVPPYPKYNRRKIVYNVYSIRFGFDPENDDYKIVKVVRPNIISRSEKTERFQVRVYSMRSGCWKLITHSPPSDVLSFFKHNEIDVSADGHDGHLHWLCSRSYGYSTQNIVAYDLAAESFSEISLPDPIKFDYEVNFYRLGAYGGKLCVIQSSGDGRYEVFVMDHQYGCWVKNGFSHLHEPGILRCGFTFKNNFIYQDLNFVIYLYDPAAPFDNVKLFLVEGKFKPLGMLEIAIPYVESLVWVTPPDVPEIGDWDWLFGKLEQEFQTIPIR